MKPIKYIKNKIEAITKKVVKKRSTKQELVDSVEKITYNKSRNIKMTTTIKNGSKETTYERC